MKRLFYSTIIGIIFLHAVKKMNLFFFSPDIYSSPHYQNHFQNYFERVKSLLNSKNQVEFLLTQITAFNVPTITGTEIFRKI